MTNLGFHLAMRDAGIERGRATDVGDRYVLEALGRRRLRRSAASRAAT